MGWITCFGALRGGAVLAGLLALAGCGDGDGGSLIPPAQQGTLRASLTDGPACGFNSVFVTVDSVRVHTSASAGDSSSGWSEIVLSPGPQKIDLLTLTNGVFYTLGETALPAGTYQQIRLVLESNASVPNANSVVPIGGVEQPLDTPSGPQSGLKINGNFTVQGNQLTDLVLDFDACKSIVRRGNGTFGLKPVISAVPLSVAGDLIGTVTGAPGAMVYAERGGQVIKATVADGSGNFKLSPIAQVANPDRVDVVIVPTFANGRASSVIRDVPVVAGELFTIGPVDPPTSIYRTVSGSVTASAQATLRATQTIGGRFYEIASTNAATDSGAYAFYTTEPALPVAPPWFGTYQTQLPIPLSEDPGAAGVYQIQAISTSGVANTQNANIRLNDVSNLNFSLQ